ncbi:hypothetical protein Pelo_6346 [Pelomyxa schiedti]|nr:hypothetical protein Pelo_6346 [Pelomyxa schiedti]
MGAAVTVPSATLAIALTSLADVVMVTERTMVESIEHQNKWNETCGTTTFLLNNKPTRDFMMDFQSTGFEHVVHFPSFPHEAGFPQSQNMTQ